MVRRKKPAEVAADSPHATHYAITTLLLCGRLANRRSPPHQPRRAKVVGLSRFELLTPRLSSVCSNQLSYRPSSPLACGSPARAHGPAHNQTFQRTGAHAPIPSKLDRTCAAPNPEYQIDHRVGSRPTTGSLQSEDREPSAACRQPCSRKEVIQPQVLLQLPCYDFTPITNHTLGACLPCGLAQRLLVQPAFVM